MISNVPGEIIKKYQKYNNIKFILPNINREELLRNYFSGADIFILPTRYDVFGMVFLEAMSCGLPVITVEEYATPEIVSDKTTGFLLKKCKTVYHKLFSRFSRRKWIALGKRVKEIDEPELVEEIVEKTSILIENEKLRKDMGENARQEISGGKFSIKNRNEKLKRIYADAVSS